MKKKAKKKAELLEKQLQQLEELEENLQINGMNEFSSLPKNKRFLFCELCKNGLGGERKEKKNGFGWTNAIERISKEKWLDLTKNEDLS